MIKTAFSEFKQTDMMKPFYIKGKATLNKLLLEINQQTLINNFAIYYRDITIENTLKIMLRCKLLFHTRTLLLTLFKEIMVYEMTATRLRDMLSKFKSYKVTQNAFDKISAQATKLFTSSERVLYQIKDLRQKKSTEVFIFKNRVSSRRLMHFRTSLTI
jgi:hypothetical protein